MDPQPCHNGHFTVYPSLYIDDSFPSRIQGSGTAFKGTKNDGGLPRKANAF